MSGWRSSADLMIAFFRTVNAILGQVPRASSVGKSDLKSGDEVLVTTENSVYSIRAHGDATYSVRGGWFDRQGLSPQEDRALDMWEHLGRQRDPDQRGCRLRSAPGVRQSCAYHPHPGGPRDP